MIEMDSCTSIINQIQGDTCCGFYPLDYLIKWPDDMINQFIRKLKEYIPFINGQSSRRERTPSVLQMEAVECGAASLAMILGYFGRLIPLEKMRIECGVTRDGTNARNLIMAGKTFGLIGKAFKKEPKDLIDLPLPLIVHWNFNHFLVLEGFRRGKFYLNDPAMGPRIVTADEFDDSFTGVVLLLQPGDGFEKRKETASFFVALSKRLKGSYRALGYCALAALGMIIPGIVVPAFTRIFIDDILVGQMIGRVQPLLWAMILATIIMGTLTWLKEFHLLKLETKLSVSSSGKFLWHVLNLPHMFYSQRFPGEIASRVALNDDVSNLLSNELAINLLNIVQVSFFLFIMFQYDVVLSILAIGIALINVVVLRTMANKRKNANVKLLQDQGKLMGTTMGGLQSIETLKATGREADFFETWSGYQAKTINTTQQMGLLTSSMSVIPTFLSTMTTIVVLSVGSLRIMDGHLTIGMFVAFQMLMKFFLEPITALVDIGVKFQDAEGQMTRLDDVLKYPTDPVIKKFKKEYDFEEMESKLTGNVEFKDVSFGYNPRSKALITNFNLVMEPGKRVAVIGGSGSGKSTIAKLLCGVYEPWDGGIFFDGKPIEDIRRVVMVNSLSLVDQDLFLFEGSIKENISLWDDSMEHYDIINACKDAAIHDIITARQGGYDNKLEEGGGNLSGGQRQRLEIARALATNPSILVLDEATSALDPAPEELIANAILSRGCSSLTIAHRLSTIRNCDEIIVMDKGQVVQRGTHDEMIDVDGTYRDLIYAG